jgi:hypothetical protein
MLHNHPILSGKKLLQEMRVLLELVSKAILHHFLLDLNPIRTKRLSSLVSSVERINWGWGTDDVQLLGRSLEFFGLEVVLIAQVNLSFNFEWRQIDIAELSKLVLWSIEVDYF